jgi:hypothetical protein
VGLLVASAIGTVPAWLTFLGVLGAAFVIWRGAGGTALQTLQTANRVLERRVHELEKERLSDKSEIAELRGKTDMALAVKPFMEWATMHELRAAERHEKTLVVLDLIAERIGPESAQ